jgi:hypothetical protein
MLRSALRSSHEAKIAAALIARRLGLHVVQHATDRSEALVASRAVVVLAAGLIASGPVLLARPVERQHLLASFGEHAVGARRVLALPCKLVHRLPRVVLPGARRAAAGLEVLGGVAHGV